MEELTRIVTRLRNALADKEIEINNSESADADEYDLLDSCKRKIDILEDRTKEAISSGSQEAAVIADIEKAAKQIEGAIERIG